MLATTSINIANPAAAVAALQTSHQNCLFPHRTREQIIPEIEHPVGSRGLEISQHRRRAEIHHDGDPPARNGLGIQFLIHRRFTPLHTPFAALSCPARPSWLLLRSMSKQDAPGEAGMPGPSACGAWRPVQSDVFSEWRHRSRRSSCDWNGSWRSKTTSTLLHRVSRIVSEVAREQIDRNKSGWNYPRCW